MLMNFQNNQFEAGLGMEDYTAVQSVEIRRGEMTHLRWNHTQVTKTRQSRNWPRIVRASHSKRLPLILTMGTCLMRMSKSCTVPLQTNRCRPKARVSSKEYLNQGSGEPPAPEARWTFKIRPNTGQRALFVQLLQKSPSRSTKKTSSRTSNTTQ